VAAWLAITVPAAEMVASVCDLGVFISGIALIAKQHWTASERARMGAAMLVMQVGRGGQRVGWG